MHRTGAESPTRDRGERATRASAAGPSSKVPPDARALAQELAATQLLQQVSLRLIQEENVSELYGHLLDAAVGMTRADFASVQALRGGRETEAPGLELLAHRGFDEQAVDHWRTVGVAHHSACGEALRTETRVVVPDVRTCAFLAGTRDLEVMLHNGILAVQSTPLVSRTGRILGMISTHWREPHECAEWELRLLDILARQAADLIERSESEHALREADRRKDEFLAVLGHELRNPLAPLATGLELLRRARAEPEVADKTLAMMERQLGHLVRLVDDLLDVTRITRGSVELSRARLDLLEIVDAAVESNAPLIDERGHELRVEREHGPLPVHGDRERLAQAVGNVLSNAARYTRPGGRITLRAREEGGDAVLRVRDTGLGIPPDRLEDVFEMFCQVPEHRALGGGGLGLGLALARQLVELHGGSIEAASDGPEHGSEFVLRIPLERTRDAEQPSEHPARGPSHPRRVLVVEDHPDVAESLRLLLDMQGHEVRVVGEGTAALDEVERFEPEVVLLDLGLPGMSGYEVGRRLRRTRRGRDCLLVAITGHGQERDRRATTEAGFDHHLTKPVRASALEGLLRLRSGSSAASSAND